MNNRTLLTFAVFGIAVGALWYWQQTGEDNNKLATRVPTQYAGSAIEKPAAAPTTGHEKRTVAASGAESKGKEVERLAASGTPEDAFRAWSMLATCNDRQRDERDARAGTPNAPAAEIEQRRQASASGALASATASACGDIEPHQILSRLALLDKAASSGFAPAAFAMMREGPWGDTNAMYSRWQEPAVQEWAARVASMLKLAAAKGNIDALESLLSQYQTGSGLVGKPDRQMALAYAYAHEVAYRRQYGKFSQARAQRIEQLTEGRSTADIEMAKATAKTILGGQ